MPTALLSLNLKIK